MRHVKDKESAREIGYLFQALQHEWERSGKTVVTRRIGQDEYDEFAKCYSKKLKNYDKERNEDEAMQIKVILKSMKEMCVLSRIAKKICNKAALSSSKKWGHFDIELDREERKCLEEIIGIN